jgi:hypothetical protein
MTALASALLATALAAIDGTAADLRVSGRVETSAVALAADGGAPRELAAVDVLPRVALALDRRALRLTLGYEPQLRVSQVLSYSGGDVAVAHGGSARAEWDLLPLWRAAGAFRSSIRLLDFVAASGGELARLLDTRAPPTRLRFRDTVASAGLEGRPTRRMTVASSISFESSGAAAVQDRGAMPLLRELRLAGSVARAETRQDTLRLELAAASAAFEVGSASFGTLTLAWTREEGRSLRFRLAAGASAPLGGSGPSGLMPGGEALVEATPSFLGRPLRAAAAVRAAPAFDRFGARIQELIAVDASATWALTARWSLGAAATAGRVREPNAYSASRADLRGAWRASPRVTVYAAVWDERHRDPRLVAGSTASYLGMGVGLELAPASR